MGISKEGLELLRKELPDWPCNRCNSQWSGYKCDECTKKAEYETAAAPYRDAGVFDYAEIIKEIKIEEKRIVKSKHRIQQLRTELPTEVTAEVLGEITQPMTAF